MHPTSTRPSTPSPYQCRNAGASVFRPSAVTVTSQAPSPTVATRACSVAPPCIWKRYCASACCGGAAEPHAWQRTVRGKTTALLRETARHDASTQAGAAAGRACTALPACGVSGAGVLPRPKTRAVTAMTDCAGEAASVAARSSLRRRARLPTHSERWVEQSVVRPTRWRPTTLLRAQAAQGKLTECGEAYPRGER